MIPFKCIVESKFFNNFSVGTYVNDRSFATDRTSAQRYRDFK